MNESKIEVMEDEKKETANNMLAMINEKSIAENMVDTVRNISIIKKDDLQFLRENQKHLSTICENTFIWRTKQQKYSILHDAYHPTLHSKFHQAILECKVFFEQAVELGKQAEEIKLKLEGLIIEREELDEQLKGGFVFSEDRFDEIKTEHGTMLQRMRIAAPEGSHRWRKMEVRGREVDLDIGAKKYQLQQCTVAMKYRMMEIRDWKQIQDQLIVAMKKEGFTDKLIWDKQEGEAEAHFYLFLHNFQAVHQSKDSGEIQNLTALARHGVDQAIGLGKFQDWVKKCNDRHLLSLEQLGYIRQDRQDKTKKGTIQVAKDVLTPRDDLYGKDNQEQAQLQ